MSNKKPKVCIKTEACKGCLLCVWVCPRKALHASKRLNSRGNMVVEHDHASGCSGCKQCMIICPDSGISITFENDHE